jgi:hypothetical protein
MFIAPAFQSLLLPITPKHTFDATLTTATTTHIQVKDLSSHSHLQTG